MAKRNVTPRAPELGQTEELKQIDTVVMPNFVTLPAKGKGTAIAAQLNQVMSALSQTAYQIARTKKAKKNDIETMKGVVGESAYTESRAMMLAFDKNTVAVSDDGSEPITGTDKDGDAYSIDNSIANVIAGPGGLLEKHDGDISAAMTEFVSSEMAMATAGLDPELQLVYRTGYFKDVHKAGMDWYQRRADDLKEGELNDRASNVLFNDVSLNKNIWPSKGKKKGQFDIDTYWKVIKEDPKLEAMTEQEYEDHMFDIVKTSIEAGKEDGLESAWGKGLAILDSMPDTFDQELKNDLRNKLNTERLEWATEVVADTIGASMVAQIGSPTALTPTSAYDALSPAMGDSNNPQVAGALTAGLGGLVNLELVKDNPNPDKLITSFQTILSAHAEGDKTKTLIAVGSKSYYAITAQIARLGGIDSSQTLVAKRNEQKFQARSDMVEWLDNEKNVGGKPLTEGEFKTHLMDTYPLLEQNVIETFYNLKNDDIWMTGDGDTKLYGETLKSMMDAKTPQEMRDIVNEVLENPDTLKALGKTGTKDLLTQLKVAESTAAERHDNALAIHWGQIHAEFTKATSPDATAYIAALMSSSSHMNPAAIADMAKVLAQQSETGADTALAQLRNRYDQEWDNWVIANTETFKTNPTQYRVDKFNKINEMITTYGELATKQGMTYRLGEPKP